MLILIKTPTITFSLDVDLQDDLEILYKKVMERTEHQRFQFNLLYAGDVLLKGSLSSNSIKRESTIHMVLIKEMKFTIVYENNQYPVEIPNNIGLKILHLKKQIRTQLKSSIEPLAMLSTTFEIYPIGATRAYTQNEDLRNTVGNFGTVELKINIPPPPPPSKANVNMKSKLNSKINRKYNDSDSESDVSSDEDYKKPYTTTTTTTTTKSTSSSLPIIPEPEVVVEEETFDEDALLNSFVESSMSSDVEIVFCFDTTGSMSTIIQSVRKQVTNTVNRLMKDIPNIKIGIMALGDYCDKNHVLLTLNLSNNVEEIVKFINAAPNTTGGDEPEAYEYALYEAKKLSWSKHTSKAFVMIGDSSPHPPSFTNLNINWFKECDDLYDMGIKIYGVRALGNSIFYDDIAERTGGISINFKRFNLITEMFLAICYREANAKKFAEFSKEVSENVGHDGDEGDQEAIKEILNDLNQENFKVVQADDTNSTSTTNDISTPDTSSISTTTTTTTTSNKKNNVVFKQYGKPSYIKLHEPWYDIQNDKDPLRYYFNENIGFFEPNISKGKKPVSETSSTTLTTSSTSTSTSPTSSLFSFETIESTPNPSIPTKKTTIDAMVIGDSGIGKTSFINGINYISKSFKSNLQLLEKAQISLDDFKNTDIFLVCLTQHKKETYSNFNNYVTEIRKRDPMKPIVAAILMKDQANSTVPNIEDIGKFQQIFSLVTVIEYSNTMKDSDVKKISKLLQSKVQDFSKNQKSCIIM